MLNGKKQLSETPMQVQPAHGTRVCIIRGPRDAVSETFITAQERALPFDVRTLYGSIAHYEGQAVFSMRLIPRGLRKMARLLGIRSPRGETTASYTLAFRRVQPDVVIAEFGSLGVRVMDACEATNTPLIVYFRGNDASGSAVLDKVGAEYPRLFRIARKIVVVSNGLWDKVLALGAPIDKMLLIPGGVDCTRFRGGRVEESGPHFVAVGRLVPKKAPDLTLRAFAIVLSQCPDARLTLIGDGPMRSKLDALIASLGIESAVRLCGAQAHDDVLAQLQRGRCFVQHSVTAPDGDMEGLPVGILEASAVGLPVVSTYHSGIPDAVHHGVTGYLVRERDVAGMADYMLALARDPAKAAQLGRAGRRLIKEQYCLEKDIQRLARVITGVVKKERRPFKLNNHSHPPVQPCAKPR